MFSSLIRITKEEELRRRSNK